MLLALGYECASGVSFLRYCAPHAHVPKKTVVTSRDRESGTILLL